LIDTISSFSFLVRSRNDSAKSIKSVKRLDELVTFELPSDVELNPWLQPIEFAQLGHERLLQFLQKQNADVREQHRIWKSENHYAHHHHNGNTSPLDTNNQPPTTWISPSIQAGAHNIRQDECVVRYFLQNVPIRGTLFVCSPYLNFTNLYQDLLLNDSSNYLSTINIVTASPQANGFFSARDLSRFIPSAYVHVEQNLFETIVHQQCKNINIVEYARAGWTFHAKGMWSFPKPTPTTSKSGTSSTIAGATFYHHHHHHHRKNSDASNVNAETMAAILNSTSPSTKSDFLVTFIGSPNLSQRSNERDLEAQLMIETTHPIVIRKFKEVRRMSEGKRMNCSSPPVILCFFCRS
jgi:phosphatidylserine/phosphatidylglycerophosphate/cardiolipin synthase-like enzyme